ncbi:MAG: LemA family protein [Treponema sp.]|jgi:LemA protein|nr:LemA family protein [Treponema sp.]
MMPNSIAISIVSGAIVLWVIVLWAMSTQRRLFALDENINNAMSQIGVQLFCRFNALIALLEIIKGYAGQESKTLVETVKSGRIDITTKSTPDEVLRQECIIDEALGRIATFSEQYPELKPNKDYCKTLDAVESYENMLYTSRLVYNDSVAKLNREIRMIPVFIIAGMLGFSKRNYLENRKKEQRKKNRGRKPVGGL